MPIPIAALLSALLIAPVARAMNVGVPAQSTSSNCKLYQSPRVQAICTDEKLATLDTRINQAYNSLLSSLSPAASLLVQSDQREWLHWLDQVCPIVNPSANSLVGCLTNRYQSRLDQLTSNPDPIGGMRFYTRAHFVFVPGEPPPSNAFAGNDPGFGYGEFAWPQIDNPSPSQQLWNQAVYTATVQATCCYYERRKPTTLDALVDGSGNAQSSYSLFAANSHLIDVDLVGSAYPWGAAHGQVTRTSFIWWLDSGRALQPGDLFSAASNWRQRLIPLTLAKLQKNPGPDALWKPGPYIKANELETGIANGVASLSTWDISSTGLIITFGSYAVGPYSSGWSAAHFTWLELDSLLASSFSSAHLPDPVKTPQE